MAGDIDKWTALAAAIGGILTGIAGMFGIKRVKSKPAPVRRKEDPRMNETLKRCEEHNNRLTILETEVRTISQQFQEHRHESQERDEKIFGMLGDVAAGVNYLKGKGDR